MNNTRTVILIGGSATGRVMSVHVDQPIVRVAQMHGPVLLNDLNRHVPTVSAASHLIYQVQTIAFNDGHRHEVAILQGVKDPISVLLASAVRLHQLEGE
jgi:hypothetical protein